MTKLFDILICYTFIQSRLYFIFFIIFVLPKKMSNVAMIQQIFSSSLTLKSDQKTNYNIRKKSYLYFQQH